MKEDKLNAINNFLKHNKFVCISALLIILNILFLNNVIINNPKATINATYIVILIISILLELGIAMFLFKTDKKSIKIENQFLIISLITGILYMMVIPIGLVPDEKNHFLRAYEISEGHIISDKNKDGIGGRVLPIETSNAITDTTEYTYNDLIEHAKVKKSDVQEFITFGNTSLYSFICYIPQTIGILTAKILNLSIIESSYLGRIFNFAVWISLMYFSIKYIPCYKKLIAFISLLPITLQEAISLSPDALTIAVAIALVSFVLYMIKTKKGKMTKIELAIMSVLAIIMSLCKIVYLPLCLLLYLIPYERFQSKKDKYIKLGLLSFSVIAINIIWLIIASQYLVEFRPGVNSAEQVMGILSNPFKYIQIIANTIIQKSDFYIFSMLGKNLECFNIDLPYFYFLITFILLVYILQKEVQDYTLNKISTKYGAIFVLVCTILLIFTSLYVQWTKVGDLIIDGVQGRYFIPILPLLPIALSKIGIKKSIKKIDNDINKYILFFLTIQNIYALFVIFYTHI